MTRMLFGRGARSGAIAAGRAARTGALAAGCAALATALLFSARDASANGRLPGASQLVFSFEPATPDLAVLRTTFGVLVSRDGGANWDWVCEGAIPGLQNGVDPAIGLTASGSIAATLLTGLDLSSANACDWQTLGCPFTNLSVIDVAVRPDAPHSIVAIASTPIGSGGGASPCPSADGGGTVEGGAGDASADAGAALYDNRLFQSVDDGAHWSALGAPIDGSFVITTVDVTASDPHRIYASGFRETVSVDAGTVREASLFVSTDDGAHWAERPIALDAAHENAVYIAAIDRTDADRVYLRTAGAAKAPSRLFVSRDGGATFEVALTLQGQMLGFALSADGTDVYAGSVEDGLFAATRDALTFQKQSTAPIACLATHGPELWACSDDKVGFLAGVSTDRGATFAPKLHLCSIRGALACGATESVGQCGARFDFLRSGFVCDRPDGGADGGSDAAALDAGGASPDAAFPTPPSDAPKSSCGCATAKKGDQPYVLFPLGLVVALAWRRTSATRSRRKHSNQGDLTRPTLLERRQSSFGLERPISELPCRAGATNSLGPEVYRDSLPIAAHAGWGRADRR